MICVFCRPYFCLWVNKPFLAINEIVYINIYSETGSAGKYDRSRMIGGSQTLPGNRQLPPVTGKTERNIILYPNRGIPK